MGEAGDIKGAGAQIVQHVPGVQPVGRLKAFQRIELFERIERLKPGYIIINLQEP
jgi:hypothetical protein